MVVWRYDICGLLCVCSTYGSIIYADYAIVEWMVIPTMYTSLWGAFNVVCFNIIVFLTLMAHTRAVFSDPGTVPLPQTNLDFSDALRANKPIDDKGDWTICSRCETYRPPRAHHCRICQRCIRRMDHHCPWINNCVGEQNQKYFIQFLLYVGLGCLYIIVLVAVSWNLECANCVHSPAYKQNRVIHSVCLLVESILFGIFVIAIMCDQCTLTAGNLYEEMRVKLYTCKNCLLNYTEGIKVQKAYQGVLQPNVTPNK
ncbi:DNZDHHC/NEW1 zinc finger protein 11 isoform X2 [Dermacentor variabilis]|uniref:DNZDHHC/NEW1 zinc finger protein 11 isoform X2 n=1 Tax=Dermacentor variabilis TaxID=34621 RepID=UPI003F5CBB53